MRYDHVMLGCMLAAVQYVHMSRTQNINLHVLHTNLRGRSVNCSLCSRKSFSAVPVAVDWIMRFSDSFGLEWFGKAQTLFTTKLVCLLNK